MIRSIFEYLIAFVLSWYQFVFISGHANPSKETMKPFRWDKNSIQISFLFSLLIPSFIAQASYKPSLILMILNDTIIQIISVAAIFLQFKERVTHNFNYFRADWFNHLSGHGSIHGCCGKCNSWNVYKPKLSNYSDIQFSPGKILIGLFSDFSKDWL